MNTSHYPSIELWKTVIKKFTENGKNENDPTYLQKYINVHRKLFIT